MLNGRRLCKNTSYKSSSKGPFSSEKYRYSANRWGWVGLNIAILPGVTASVNLPLRVDWVSPFSWIKDEKLSESSVPEIGLLFRGVNLFAEVLQLELLLSGVVFRVEDVPVSQVDQVHEVPVQHSN